MPGWNLGLRFVLEVAALAGLAAAAWKLGSGPVRWVAVPVVGHYLISLDRIEWLVQS